MKKKIQVNSGQSSGAVLAGVIFRGQTYSEADIAVATAILDGLQSEGRFLKYMVRPVQIAGAIRDIQSGTVEADAEIANKHNLPAADMEVLIRKVRAVQP